MNPYSHVTFRRPLKSFVLSELRQMFGFAEHQASVGETAEYWTVEQIQLACVALNYDLNARKKYFFEHVFTGVIKGRRYAGGTASPASPASPSSASPSSASPASPSSASPSSASPSSASPSSASPSSASPSSASPASPAASLASLPAVELNADDDEEDEDEGEASMAKADETDEGEAGEAAPSYEGRPADEIIAEALSPISHHLTPYLAQHLPVHLAALAAAAAMGPRTIVAAPLAAGEAAAVNVIRWEHAHKAFGLKRNEGGAGTTRALADTMLPICDYALAPRIDADYAWQGAILAQLAACDAAGLKVLCHGPAGTGKTEGLEQYAARLHRPFFRIAVNRGTEPPDIIGQDVPSKDGGTTWQDGLLSAAFRVPYAVILIDEISILQPDAAAIFQTALDTRRIFTPHEVIEAAQGVFICAADNTCGVGDASGRYVGTNAMNIATLDRFDLRLAFNYLPTQAEINMLARRTRLPAAAVKPMVEFASLTRNKAQNDDLTTGLSPRRLLAWARLVKAGVASQIAFDGCVMQGTAPDDREIMLALQTSSLHSQHTLIDNLAHGTPSSASPNAAPPVSGVGATFTETDDEPL